MSAPFIDPDPSILYPPPTGRALGDLGALVKKLAEVMAAVDRIPKRGRNDFHKYDYATEADIVEAVRAELATRSVMLIPQVDDVAREPIGEKGSVLTTLRMRFAFVDGESGATIERPWVGCGTDKDDKGIYKAMTGAEKYFLLKTFLIPTGDDPEQDDDGKRKGKSLVDAPPKVAPVPHGPLTIVRVDAPPAPRDKPYTAVLSDGQEVTIWNDRVVSLAMEIAQEHCEIDPTINKSGQLTQLKRKGGKPNGSAPLVPELLTAKDVGF